jgi:hypothetical protein
MARGFSPDPRGADGSAVIPPTAAARLLAAHLMLLETGRGILTDDGVRYLRAVMAGVPGAPDLPSWDGDRRQLWHGGRLLKEFRQPAPNQTALLDAFERRGWAARHVMDPLPPGPGEREDELQLRLQETVKNLNRGLPPGTIRFRGDGTGRGVWWEPVPAPATPK